jgi:hypothetical protein
MICCSPRWFDLRTAARSALFEMVGELGGVLSRKALQLSRISLNRRSVHTKDHRYLRE